MDTLSDSNHVNIQRNVRLVDGREVHIRPITLDDEEKMVLFHQTLSDQTVYQRYFHLLGLQLRTSHERLVEICNFEPGRHLVYVAEVEGGIVGVARLECCNNVDNAEFAIVISDRVQRCGLGKHLLSLLIEIATNAGIKKISADILSNNSGMIRLCENLGFCLQWVIEDNLVRVNKRLSNEHVS